MSLSLGSSQFSPPYAPPAVPDIHSCDPWYFKANDTADINDCKVAFELLPKAPDLIEWAINGDPVHKNNSHQLPYNSTFGQCKIATNSQSNTPVESNPNPSRYLSNNTLRLRPLSPRTRPLPPLPLLPPQNGRLPPPILPSRHRSRRLHNLRPPKHPLNNNPAKLQPPPKIP